MIKINQYNQRKDNHNWLKVIIFAVAVVTGGWSFFWLPYFRISNIEINDPLVNKREVEEKLGLSLLSLTQFFLPKNNFFLFPSKVAEEAILESGLGVAEVEKRFPNRISIDFKEVKPKFLYCLSEECFYLDKNGILYETAPFFSESPLPVLKFTEKEKEINFGEAIIPQNETEFFLNFIEEIKQQNLSIKKIELNKDIKLTTNEGWQIVLVLGDKDYKNIAEKLFLLFERKIKDRLKLQYIDMRFENKAFFKLSP